MLGQIRQGEILLIPVNDVTGLEETSVDNALLGIGETGNSHVVEGLELRWLHDAIEDVNAIKTNGATHAQRDIYLRVGDDATITHRATDEPHDTLTLPKGTYLVRIDREVMPFENESRFVVD